MSAGAAFSRPLEGCRIGISVSESDDLLQLGFLPPSAPGELAPDLKRVLSDLTVALVSSGATIIYGGDLRPGGFTLALFQETAHAYRTAELDKLDPVFVNVLAGTVWRQATADRIFEQVRQFGELGETRLMLPAGNAIALRGRFETQKNNAKQKCIVELACDTALGIAGAQATSAAELERLLAAAKSMPDPDTAKSLTAMRRAMATEEHGRILIGGRVKGYGGNHPDAKPGLGEEAMMTLENNKLLLPVASFGGAAHDIAEALGLLPSSPLVKHVDVGPNYWKTMESIKPYAKALTERFLLDQPLKNDIMSLVACDVPARIGTLASRLFVSRTFPR